MTKSISTATLMCTCLMWLTATPETLGDEGMYLFNDLPTKQLKQNHDFDATPQWADHLSDLAACDSIAAVLDHSFPATAWC